METCDLKSKINLILLTGYLPLADEYSNQVPKFFGFPFALCCVIEI